MLKGFGVHLLAHDPFKSPEDARNINVRFEELLQSSDFVSRHAPLLKSNCGMINRASLAHFKRDAFLINLARGGLIESLDVLFDRLESGYLAGVGLDVCDPEPPDHTHPIFGLPNVITAPHALAMSQAVMRQIFESVAKDMAAIFEGRRPRYVVNPEIFEPG